MPPRGGTEPSPQAEKGHPGGGAPVQPGSGRHCAHVAALDRGLAVARRESAGPRVLLSAHRAWFFDDEECLKWLKGLLLS